MEAAGRPHFGALLRQFRQRCLKLRRLFNNRPKKEIKQKDPVSVSEAVRILHAPTSRLRELLGERKIYYLEHWGKRLILRKAIENFVNGLPAILLVIAVKRLR